MERVLCHALQCYKLLSSTKLAKFGIILRSEGCLIRLRPYKLLNRLGYRNMFKNTCFYGHSENVNFAVQGSEGSVTSWNPVQLVWNPSESHTESGILPWNLESLDR